MGIGGAIVKGLTKIAGITGKAADDAAAAADNITDVARVVDNPRPLKALGVTDDILQKSPFLKYIDETPGVFKVIYNNAGKLDSLPPRAQKFLSDNVDIIGPMMASNAKYTDQLFEVLEKAPQFKKLAKENFDNITDLSKTIENAKTANIDDLAKAADETTGIAADGTGGLAARADNIGKFGEALRKYPKFAELGDDYFKNAENAFKKMPPSEVGKIKGIIKKLEDGKTLDVDGVDAKAIEKFLDDANGPGWFKSLVSSNAAARNKAWAQLALWGAVLGMGMYFVIKLIKKATYNGTITEIKYDAKTWGEGVFINHTPGMDINRKDEIVVSEAKVAGVDGTHTARQVIGPSQYVLSAKPPSPWPGDCTSSPCGKLYIRPNFFATLGETVGDAAAGVATAATEVAKGLFDGLLDGLGLGGMGWIKWVCLALIICSSAMLTIGIAMKFM